MKSSILVLYGTVTGNSEYCADKTARELREKGYEVVTENLADADPMMLKEHETVLIITSTYGDGEPPDGAEDFYQAVVKRGGLDLAQMQFSVLALGDTGYDQFCKCGIDFDEALATQGAQRVHPIVLADTDYDAPFDEWKKGVLAALAERRAVAA